MNTLLSTFTKSGVLLAAVACMASAVAQTANAPTSGSLLGQKEQTIERIVHEDKGSKIEEVRYGGVTQSITVESKLGGVPYEVVPADGTRNITPGWNNAKDSAGKAQWKIGNF